MKLTNKQKIKRRNRIITLVSAIISGYIILFNNSLDFLSKFGIKVDNVIAAFFLFIVILFWSLWKSQNGEL